LAIFLSPLAITRLLSLLPLKPAMAVANSLKTKLTSLWARTLVTRAARLAGHKPVASITFDDFPKNAWTLGGPVLARHGVCGTYYTAGGFCGRTVQGTEFYDESDLAALAAAGHEIGCHGFGHQPTPTLTDDELAADAMCNREFLRPFLSGGVAQSYAFPFGRVSPRTKRFFTSRFKSARGTHPGINIGRVDLSQLNVVSLETRCWNEKAIEADIQRVLHCHGWLILYTHDVSDTPSRYGSTPQMLDWALGRLAAARIEILPMREALPVALGL
jgi:peptidoglycan/xylan/chitin deacetylase (PgdA/CDA1 family)